MKTAIIKTSFWKEDKIFELVPDTRYFYLCLLTNPDRNGTPAFKCSDRMIIAYTGYTQETINICKQQLIDKGLIDFIEGYYVINDQDYVTAKTGRLSGQLYEKDFSSLPLGVQNLLKNRSSTTLEGIGISKGISKSKGIEVATEPKKYDEEDKRLGDRLYQLKKQNFQSFTKDPKDSDYIEINKLHRIDKVEYKMIEYIIEWCQENDFWKKVIQSGGGLRRNYPTMITNAEADYNRNNRTRTVVI